MKTNQLTQFRHEVYQNFNNCKRTDMLMDLVDALSSNTTARSVVELTLNPHFRRHYTALNKAVGIDALKDQQLAHLACQTIGAPLKRKFHLLGTDVTSNPRPFADTLADRGFVYQPNTIKGNKPIVIGHQYSFWCLVARTGFAQDGQLDRAPVHATGSQSGEQGTSGGKTTGRFAER